MLAQVRECECGRCKLDGLVGQPGIGWAAAGNHRVEKVLLAGTRRHLRDCLSTEAPSTSRCRTGQQADVLPISDVLCNDPCHHAEEEGTVSQ